MPKIWSDRISHQDTADKYDCIIDGQLSTNQHHSLETSTLDSSLSDWRRWLTVTVLTGKVLPPCTPPSRSDALPDDYSLNSAVFRFIHHLLSNPLFSHLLRFRFFVRPNSYAHRVTFHSCCAMSVLTANSTPLFSYLYKMTFVVYYVVCAQLFNKYHCWQHFIRKIYNIYLA